MPIDYRRLRNLLSTQLHAISQSHRHKDLDSVFESLGLPAVNEGSKAERMAGSFAALPESECVPVARRLLSTFPLDPASRYQLEELLWMDDGSPRLTVRLRREIAQALSVENLFLDACEFERLLDRLWVLDDDPFEFFSQSSNSLRTRIRRHVFENPGDWTVEELFKAVGAYDCSDRRFSTFVESLSSSRIRPSEAGQRRFVDIVNRVLATGDVELREVEHEDGYPAFRVVAKSGVVSGRPKNLIFASPRKPDIRFLDAITNDIEIASNPADVLVYDRPIPSTGLNWRDLQSWWAETNAIADQEQAKRSLYTTVPASVTDATRRLARLACSRSDRS